MINKYEICFSLLEVVIIPIIHSREVVYNEKQSVDVIVIF